jgi:pimeloyl-ACP methyl ester carboxylesterase
MNTVIRLVFPVAIAMLVIVTSFQAQPPATADGSSPAVPQFRPFETAPLTGTELLEILQERFSSQRIWIPDSYDERADATLTPFKGSFMLDTPLESNPQVEVVYRVPLRSNKTAGPDASNIVMVGLWWARAKPRKEGEESDLHRYLNFYSDSLGYSAFSLHFRSSDRIRQDPREDIYNAGPEWLDVIFRAKAEIERLHKLKPRKLLLYGHSIGGALVQRVAAARPEDVAAVALNCASDVTLPTERTDTAWFLAINRGDSMRSAYESLYNNLAKYQSPFAFSIFPPNFGDRGTRDAFYHNESPIARAACRSYLRGVVDSRGSAQNTDPTKWPYVRNRAKPLRIFASNSPVAKAIPPELREYLPSRAFAQCLFSLPAPVQRVTLSGDGSGALSECLVGLPPLGKPKGVLLYAHDPVFTDIAKLYDNIYYLAGNGYLVLAPKMNRNEEQQLQSVLQFVKGNSLLSGLPLVAAGYGKAGNTMWDFLAGDPRISPSAVAVLEFDPHTSLDESKLALNAGIKCPTLFVYDEKPLADVSTSEEARQSLVTLNAVKEYIAKRKERHQMARVVVIPQNTRSDAQTAQFSIDHAEDFLTKVIENRTSQITIP